ncbi:MAG: hypothetical protein RL685_4102 [Pseudomonadota bacterium]|jgi:cytochrome c peroxidase
MKRLFSLIILQSGILSSAGAQEVIPPPAPPPRTPEELRCDADPRVKLGLVRHDTCVGAELFFRNTFSGNGRTCGSCHPAGNNYTLDADYIATLADEDPLFVAEHDPQLAELEIPELLRQHGLILANVDGFEDPTRKFVVRSVQSLLGLSMSVAAPPPDPTGPRWAMDGTFSSIPAQRLGWSGDGAPGDGTLRDFAEGAIRQHATRSLRREAGVDFVLPTERQKDALAAFSRRIGRMSELRLEEVELTDAGAERGRLVFEAGAGRECAFRCHNNAGANTEFRDVTGEVYLGRANATLDIGTPLARLPEVDALGIGLDGGFGQGPLDSDGDGVDDSFGNGGMNVPSIIEAADTAPFFHSNAAATVEDAIRFYTTPAFANSLVGFNAFFDVRKRLEPIALSEHEISEMGRFLRVINTALNLQMAIYRLRAAADVTRAYGQDGFAVARGLAQLAEAELADAASVLGEAPPPELYGNEQAAITRARRFIELGLRPEVGRERRSQKLSAARVVCELAYRGLGTGLDLQLGDGTLMY